MEKINVEANDVINILTQRIAGLEKELAIQTAINMKNKRETEKGSKDKKQ